ncbi:MAG TPA: hypothetical protein P5238_06915, partial [Smithellaceae bacterium]|nr:hypothetical protein [Smithellaceae bacterium]
FMENMDNRDFVENFVRMERWIFDSPDVPGETFRQFVEDGYKNNLLIQSKMRVGGTRVDLKKITMPLLNFFGEYDHLVPPEACNQLTGAVGSTDAVDVCLETGHIGIYVSSRFQRQFAPRIVQWLKQRDTEDRVEAAPAKEMPGSRREVPLNKPSVRKKRAVRKAGAKPKTPAGTNITPPAPVRKNRQSLIQKIAEAI